MTNLDEFHNKSGPVNKRVLKALVIPLKKQQDTQDSDNTPHSKQLEDPFEALTLNGQVIEPPFDLLGLTMLPELNSEMNQVIEAMETNIDGFGHHLVSRVEVEAQGVGEDLKKAVRSEKVFLENFFNYVSLDDSFIALRKKVRRDLETTGNGYIEIIRGISGDIQGMAHIPAYQMRLGKISQIATEIDFPILQLNADGSVSKAAIHTLKRFRPYVQSRSLNTVKSMGDYKFRWFKEFGDPRVIDNDTGEEVSSAKVDDWDGKGNPMPEARKANEVVHFRIYSSRSPYGIPRYIGNILSIYGDRKAEEINYYTFVNNNIPSMLLMVSNGQLTQGTIDRIKNFSESQIGESANYSQFLILEAEGQFEGEDPGPIKLDVKPLTSDQHKDALFQNYSKNNQEKVRRAWRLPPIFVGESAQYNRATAETSRKLADEQIFAPERYEFDAWINRRLFPTMGIIFHRFKSNSPNTTDNTELVKILSGSEKTGGVTPRIARLILEDILGDVVLPPFKEDPRFDPDLPFSLSMAEAVKNKADVVEPGQQVTALKVLEVLKRLEAIMNSEENEEGAQERSSDEEEY